MPFFITSTMGNLPGLPGLCIAGIFCASLSTVSSAINSLAAVTLQDLIVPLFPNTAANAVFYTKGISILYGVLCIALSFIIASLGNLIKMTIVLVGLFAGPNLAVFLLATCSTTANEEGVILGLLVSVSISAYLSFAPSSNDYPFLALSNECPQLEESSTPLQNSSFFSFRPPRPNSIINDSISNFLHVDLKHRFINLFNNWVNWKYCSQYFPGQNVFCFGHAFEPDPSTILKQALQNRRHIRRK